MKVIFLIFVLIDAGSAIAQAISPATPLKTTLCEIARDPGAFNHKLVQVSATASHGFEDSTLTDAECGLGKDPPWFWFEYGGSAVTGTMYCCGLTDTRTRPETLKVEGIEVPLLHDLAFRSLDILLHQPPDKKYESAHVRTTLQGLVFAQYTSIAPNATNIPKRWSGYGHMGCCILIAVERVLSVDPTPSQEKYLKHYRPAR
jgi:hypothetical protein